MDTTRSVQENTLFSTPDEKIHASDLLAALNHYENKIKVLSLDCFDTILWRKTATPIDMFYDLQHRPAFKALGFTSVMRVTAEYNARKYKLIQHTQSEVKLSDIYQAHFPDLSKEQLQALTNDELAAEMEACYAFPPVIELIRAAHAKKIQTIIVSDTYFKLHELTQLLKSKLPADVMAAINTIFCSCEYGKSKHGGIFKDVIKKLNIPAQAILHIGDNRAADFTAPKKMKIHALHLQHHDESIEDIFRMQTLSASLLNPDVRYQRALHHPFRGLLAAAKISPHKTEELLGYATLGPIIYAFASYILSEISQIEKSGKKIKPVFLMRDAYLPSLGCDALAGQPIGKRIRISRFTSYAASFRTQKDVDRYLIEVMNTNRFADIARQLLIPSETANALIRQASNDAEPALKFSQLVREESVLNMIFKESVQCRRKLKNYLEKEIDLQKGDTLLFIDLGYSGTAQRLLEPVFKEEFGVDIIGRYLIALPIANWENSRGGLLDRSHFDERTLHSLVAYIALLEQLCTSSEKSVVGYDDEGNPLFNDSTFSNEQYQKLHAVHTECIRFIKDAELFLKHISLSPDILRDNTASALARMIFIPTLQELQYLQSFEFDLNLGTKDIFNMFDIEKGLIGLRRRGMFASFMERNSKSFRTNTPAELRAAGLDLSLTLLAQHRFSLDFRLKDVNFRQEEVNIIVMHGKDSTQATLEAQITHDGYYALCVPLGTGNFQIGILFGQKYQWVEIDSVELIKMNAFLTTRESEYCEDYSSNLLFGQMENRAGKLFECTSPAGFMMINPALQLGNRDNYAVRIIFRPVVGR